MGQEGQKYFEPDSKPSETENSEIDQPPRHEQGRFHRPRGGPIRNGKCQRGDNVKKAEAYRLLPSIFNHSILLFYVILLYYDKSHSQRGAAQSHWFSPAPITARPHVHPAPSFSLFPSPPNLFFAVRPHDDNDDYYLFLTLSLGSASARG